MHVGQGKCSRPFTVCLPPGTKLPFCLWLQAFLTVRKGNKKLAVYDLTLVLSWVGRWEGDDKEVFPQRKYAFLRTRDSECCAVCIGWARILL